MGVPPVKGLIFVITNESGSLPISRTCHIYICTFLPSRSRSYFSVKFKPWDDVCVQISSHTHIHLGHITSRKTLWKKQSRFNCNGLKSAQQPIRTSANDQRRWKVLCFISLFRVGGVSLFCENWGYYKGRFRDFELFIRVWITALVSLRHILPVSKQVEEISPVISAPVCTCHTHILPYSFPAKFSDTSVLRIIFGLNQLPSQLLPQSFIWLILRRTRIPWKWKTRKMGGIPQLKVITSVWGIWQSFASTITNHLTNLMSAPAVSKLGAWHGRAYGMHNRIFATNKNKDTI